MVKKSYQDPRSEELIPIVYARNLTEAEFYRTLLAEHDIPVVIEKNSRSGPSRRGPEEGVPVLVAEENLADAQAVIEQRYSQEDEIEAEFEVDREEDGEYVEDDPSNRD